MKEINHQFGNLRVMAFEGEMSAGYEMDFGIGQVALEGFGTFRDERRVVLSPDSQQWGDGRYGGISETQGRGQRSSDSRE